MNRSILGFVLIAGLCAAAQAVHAQTGKPSRLVEAIAKKGSTKCNAGLDVRVKDVHQNDADYGHYVTWNSDAADKRTVYAVTSENFSDIGGMVTVFTASPDASGDCTITSAQIFATPKSCTAAREETFKVWKFFGEIGATSIYQREDSKGLTVFLTPMKTGGCMVVRRVVIYQ